MPNLNDEQPLCSRADQMSDNLLLRSLAFHLAHNDKSDAVRGDEKGNLVRLPSLSTIPWIAQLAAHATDIHMRTILRTAGGARFALTGLGARTEDGRARRSSASDMAEAQSMCSPRDMWRIHVALCSAEERTATRFLRSEFNSIESLTNVPRQTSLRPCGQRTKAENR